MNRTMLAILGFVLLISCGGIFAQDEGDDDPRGNVNLGMPISAPINPTARFTHLGIGISAGAGYNFTRRHAVVGEFTASDLLLNNGALDPIRTISEDPSLGADSNLYALTGNYRFEQRGKALGMYFIGGGGWYFRTGRLSHSITTGSGIACTPAWLWWGFACKSGAVVENQTLKSSSSSVLGVNGGIGFTARVGDAPYRVYVESRYHYAPTKGISTHLVAVTVGIRY